MVAELTLPQHLEGMREALVAFVRHADRAGLRTAVPTTPDWTVRRLIAHQGMVHRWATSLIRGEQADPDRFAQEGQDAPDPVEWLRDGAIDLAQSITEAPDDLSAPVFLKDAPPAKRFWARRQCHETTIHAADALSAALGRYPKAADTWISEAVALDGIDELLTGFLTRDRSRLRSEEPLVLAVRPDDGEAGWEVAIGPEPAVTRRTTDPRGDIELAGSAVALYLTLWNRSDEVTAPQLWEETAIRWG